jgi:hypothetical protein
MALSQGQARDVEKSPVKRVSPPHSEVSSYQHLFFQRALYDEGDQEELPTKRKKKRPAKFEQYGKCIQPNFIYRTCF